jgi:hypothetical protein
MPEPTDSLDSRQIIPAPPGWVARRLRLNEKTNSIDTDYLPVVAWAIGAETHGDRAPIIWDIGAHEIGIPAELEAADGWTGVIDTYCFDADALGAPPEVDEEAARHRLMDEGDFEVWVAERRQSRARLVGHSPTD